MSAVKDLILKTIGISRLPYLEIHLTEHCNLNCKGCCHFSCIAEPEFADIGQYSNDLKRIKQLFVVKTIRLLGGEPLLANNIVDFLKITRSILGQKTNISLVTNGILLHAMPDAFWLSMKDNNIQLDVTLYPIMFDREQEIIELCQKYNIKLIITKRIKFYKCTDFQGLQKKSFKKCKYQKCIFLSNGEIAACAFPFVLKHVNKKFNLNIQKTGTINIYKYNSNKILKHLNKPFELCKYCMQDEQYFDWGTTKYDISEWTYVRH
jgi:hypothetical protein